MKSVIIYFLFLSYTYSAAYAQAESKLGTWVGATAKWRSSGNWEYFLQGEWRSWEVLQNLNELLFRAALHYHLNEQHMLAAGYVRVDTWPYDGEPFRKFYENRAFQEYLLKTKWTNIKVDHRFRLEQRWITSPGDGSNYSNRFRYMLAFGFPTSGPYTIKLFNELFVDLDNRDYWFNREGDKAGLNQNRTFIGLARPISKSSSVQLGVLLQHRPTSDFWRIVIGYGGAF